MTWEGVHRLMVQAKGDTAAWNQLHALVRPFLLELAGKTLGPGWPDRSASDLLQTTLLHAWENLETFRGGVDDDSTTAILRAWLARIMRNAHHNDVRYHQAGRRTLRDGCKFLAEPERAEAPARDPTPSQAA
ncbi:MAG: sigma-70 family RNA polymerase sigma factor, partial [Gemmataceae bacterium]|nr:sigma-70 family RNA polymerase sigma factor [Gemmataceae bacterium]